MSASTESWWLDWSVDTGACRVRLGCSEASAHAPQNEAHNDGTLACLISDPPCPLWLSLSENGLVTIIQPGHLPASVARPPFFTQEEWRDHVELFRDLARQPTQLALRNKLVEHRKELPCPLRVHVFESGRHPVVYEWDCEGLHERVGARPQAVGRNESRLELALTGRNCRLTDHQTGQCMDVAVTAEATPLQGDSPPSHVPEISFDVRALFREKAPAIYRRIPGWIWRSLEKLVRQEVINSGLHAMAPVSCRNFPEAVLKEISAQARAPVSPLVPASERPVFVCNHPQGGLDGLVMLSWLLRWYPEVKVPVNDVLCGFRHLRPFLAPLDRYRSSRDMRAVLHETFASGAAVLVFPAGRTARMHQGRLRDAPWGKMAVRMALHHQRPVVPVYLGTRNSRGFYLLARLRRMVRVDLNLEMLLLAREMLQTAPREAGFVPGSPFTPGSLREMADDDQVCAAGLQTYCETLRLEDPAARER